MLTALPSAWTVFVHLPAGYFTTSNHLHQILCCSKMVRKNASTTASSPNGKVKKESKPKAAIKKEKEEKKPRLTDFRRRVYALLKRVPKGKITTYGRLADALGSSPRAVGGALRLNPFAPIVPCHRVVKSDFSIGGFHGYTGGMYIVELFCFTLPVQPVPVGLYFLWLMFLSFTSDDCVPFPHVNLSSRTYVHS